MKGRQSLLRGEEMSDSTGWGACWGPCPLWLLRAPGHSPAWKERVRSCSPHYTLSLSLLDVCPALGLEPSSSGQAARCQSSLAFTSLISQGGASAGGRFVLRYVAFGQKTHCFHRLARARGPQGAGPALATLRLGWAAVAENGASRLVPSQEV